LVFWTRAPQRLIEDQGLLESYRIQIHVTVTGWTEVEHGAPNLEEGIELLKAVCGAYGPARVVLRFSPVPVVPDVVTRWERLVAAAAAIGIPHIYVAFLQPNDRMVDPRSPEEQFAVLTEIAQVAETYGVQVRLCQDGAALLIGRSASNLSLGVCVPVDGLTVLGRPDPVPEGCGCVLMADPFTANESCVFNCSYCYAADQSLNPEKRNTTLKVLP
jgi:DNA repair photolyase